MHPSSSKISKTPFEPRCFFTHFISGVGQVALFSVKMILKKYTLRTQKNKIN